MKQRLLLCFVVCALAGCGDKYDPNLGQNATSSELAAADARRSEVESIYERAGGNWDSMSAADRQRFIELSGNNEGMARQGWGFLAKKKGG